MKDLCFKDIENASFSLYEGNPVIRNPMPSLVIADPSVLTPAESHNGKWNLFCHTFFGIYHYESSDGISFKKVQKIASRAMRPNVNYIDGKYYVFFERTRPVILNALSLIGVKWESEIYVTESEDLVSWTEPRLALGYSREYEKAGRGYALSNPFLIKNGDMWRLYYSCGLTFIRDCGFSEPTYVSFAESRRIRDGYTARKAPVIKPDKNDARLNLCSGCLKIYKLSDCYIGLQNGIYEKDGKSHSAIMLLRSDDGVNFEFVKDFLVPQKCGDNNWMAQYVYACCLTCYEGKLRLYFNARNVSDNIRGRECIGIYEADVKR